MTQQPYLWTREHTRERLQKIDALRRATETLFDEPGDRGHHARHQWLGSRHDDMRRETLYADTLWNGVAGRLHLQVISSRAWFAREIYQRALARTHARYPGFDAHRYADGTRIGERLLSFSSEAYELAAMHLWTSLWKVIEDEAPTVNECLIETPCSAWGYAPAVAAHKRCGHEMTGARRLTLIRHVDMVKDIDMSVLEAQVCRGEMPLLDATPRAWKFEEIRDGFIELSAPELSLLNHADSRKPLTAADLAMHKAVDDLDGPALQATLSAGSDVNSIGTDNDAVLTRLVETWNIHRYLTGLNAEELRESGWAKPDRTVTLPEALAMMDALLAAGAHPNVHVPDACTAINQAALNLELEMAERLLAHGANAALSPYSDGHPDEWPQTWDSPAFDMYESPDRKEVATAFVALLERTRPTPYYKPDASKHRE